MRDESNCLRGCNYREKKRSHERLAPRA